MKIEDKWLKEIRFNFVVESEIEMSECEAKFRN